MWTEQVQRERADFDFVFYFRGFRLESCRERWMCEIKYQITSITSNDDLTGVCFPRKNFCSNFCLTTCQRLPVANEPVLTFELLESSWKKIVFAESREIKLIYGNWYFTREIRVSSSLTTGTEPFIKVRTGRRRVFFSTKLYIYLLFPYCFCARLKVPKWRPVKKQK